MPTVEKLNHMLRTCRGLPAVLAYTTEAQLDVTDDIFEPKIFDSVELNP